MAEDGDTGSYDVGYGKPPQHTRFAPGVSGNPRGRPRGARGLKAELNTELDEFVTITEEGKSKRIRKRRLIIKALTAKAAKGNVAAADKLLSLVIQAQGFEDERPDRPTLSETERRILDQFLGTEAEAIGDEAADEADGSPDALP